MKSRKLSHSAKERDHIMGTVEDGHTVGLGASGLRPYRQPGMRLGLRAHLRRREEVEDKMQPGHSG